MCKNIGSEKYLGEGFYYKVYDLDGGRVFKKLQPYWFSFKKIYDYRRKAGDGVITSLLAAHRARNKEELRLRQIKEKMAVIPTYLFANPIFLSDLDYSQDKVTVVSEILAHGHEKAGKDIVDQYIDLQRTLWSYGVHDTTFKIQQNYGLDINGKLACLDFGEFVYTKEEAIKSLEGMRWQKRGSYKNWPNGVVKDYYTRKMETEITTKNLGSYWNKQAT